MPLVYASKLRHLASQFPLSNVLPDLPPAPLGSRSYVDTETTSGSEAQAADLGAASGAGSSILRNATAATSPSSSVIPLSTPPKAFVYMVVKASRYTLAQIDVTEKNARGFFQAIVENYNQKRGWRQLLSIYVYSHCDFVKVNGNGQDLMRRMKRPDDWKHADKAILATQFRSRRKILVPSAR